MNDVKKVSVLGFLAGGVVDIVSTNILAIPFVSYVLVQQGLLGQRHLEAALTAAIHANIGLTIAQWSIGGLGSVIGGYVAAWIAKKHGVLNGALSSYLCIAIGIFAWNSSAAAHVSWFERLAELILSPAFGALGGYLRQLQFQNSRVASQLH